MFKIWQRIDHIHNPPKVKKGAPGAFLQLYFDAGSKISNIYIQHSMISEELTV